MNLLIWIVVFAWLLSSQALHSAPLLPLARPGALVVSSTPYHYEVTAFFCYHLQQLNFDVHTFLIQTARKSMEGVAFNLLYPFITSAQFFPVKYEHEPLQIPPNLRVLVYITMNTQEEYKMMCEYSKIHDQVYNLVDHVIMVNHRASSAPLVHTLCKPPKCTIFHLSRHVHNTALRLLQQHNVSNHQLAFANAVHKPKWYPQAPEKATLLMKKFTNMTKMLVIQGNIDTKRRNYKDLLKCVKDMRATGLDLQVICMGGQMINFQIPPEAKSYVTALQYLPFPDFYSVIQHADFVLSFLNKNNSYNNIRSSASVPTSIMNGAPIVLPGDVLSLYACLNASEAYRRMARPTDCASLQAALALSPQAYAHLRADTMACRETWLEHATQSIRAIVTRQYDKKGGIHELRCPVGEGFTSGDASDGDDSIGNATEPAMHLVAPKRPHVRRHHRDHRVSSDV
eukprot:gene28846-34815_t